MSTSYCMLKRAENLVLIEVGRSLMAAIKVQVGSWKRKGWTLKSSSGEINENILQTDLLDNKAMWMDCFRFGAQRYGLFDGDDKIILVLGTRWPSYDHNYSIVLYMQILRFLTAFSSSK